MRKLWITLGLLLSLTVTLSGCQLVAKIFPSKKLPDDIPNEEVTTKKPQLIIRIPIGSEIYMVNDQEISNIDYPPAFIDQNSITMVPLRLIMDIIVAKVEWLPNSKEIIISDEKREIRLQINNPKAIVNNMEYDLISPPVVKNERTYVPVKFIAENLDFTSEWIPETKTLVLSK
ncbi:copper amine oxidase N-terminal domain-containing protein [bacterium]|nr:copper amine oxidase N-terminal domain-containing protein [bacterium]